ncbi:hypothetical protein LJR220_002533 [Bradyrhizobium sp. LjRoot220]|uniref:hypothetical protein n=1 Tax=Bradyrhizobium sp. LjRoot220 TaxID=3342284 RepID=UPI003ED149C3
MVDARKYVTSSFITLADVAEGPLRLTIMKVADGKNNKLDATFEEGFSLSLNATNTKRLVKALGADTDGWIGQVIEAYAGEITYEGKDQPAVVVRPMTSFCGNIGNIHLSYSLGT